MISSQSTMREQPCAHCPQNRDRSKSNHFVGIFATDHPVAPISFPLLIIALTLKIEKSRTRAGHHRFRCLSEEPRCLSTTKEWGMETSIVRIDLIKLALVIIDTSLQ
jgi:hypothetical protein